jgi:hypothetical protein
MASIPGQHGAEPIRYILSWGRQRLSLLVYFSASPSRAIGTTPTPIPDA